MSLSRWQRSIVTEAGDTIAEAEIEVFDAGESTKPDLFQDSDGSTALTNPFNADGSGFAAFYVAGGRYDIAVNGSVIWTNVALGTVQSRDVGTGSDQVPDNATFGVTSSGVVPEMVGRGAIVESDTNANGSYVRWENGEQAAWRRFSDISGPIDNDRDTAGGWFTDRGGLESGALSPAQLAADFVGDFYPLYSLKSDAKRNILANIHSISTDSVTVRFLSPESLSNVEIERFNLVVWGYWK